MTEQLFAVIRTRGPRWNDAEPLDGQEDWRGHADCWTVKDLLRTRQVSPWHLRLGSLGRP